MIGVALLVGLAVAGGFVLPDRASIERGILIDRAPATVFTVLDGFRHYEHWSPLASLDPAMKTRLEGPIDGVGARYVWSSEIPSVGSGSQQIVESVPYSHVVVHMVFSGSDAQNTAAFDLVPEGEGTRVTWHHEVAFGSSLVDRYMGLMLERMVGPDCERGLAQLKAHVESLPAVDFAGITVDRIDIAARPIAYVSGRSDTAPLSIARAYEKAYAQLTAALSRDAVKPSGPPLAIGRKWDADRHVYEFDAAIPVPAGTRQPRTDRTVRIGESYAGLVLRSVHRGPHEGLAAHLQKLMAYKLAVGFESNGSPWDVYISNANGAGPGPVTETYVPVK